MASPFLIAAFQACAASGGRKKVLTDTIMSSLLSIPGACIYLASYVSLLRHPGIRALTFLADASSLLSDASAFTTGADIRVDGYVKLLHTTSTFQMRQDASRA